MFERKLPSGTTGLAFEGAIKRLVLTQSLTQLFQSWGYLPVDTPIVDFYEVYRNLVRPQDVYRFTDREGDLVLLRNDATLFLARMLGLQLSEIKEPLRLWYAEETISHVPANHPVSDTGFQAGAEFIGAQEGEADWEIIVLASEALRRLGLTQFRIHLGSRALFHLLMEKEGIRVDDELIRDVHRLSGPAWEKLPAKVQDLLKLIGNLEQISAKLEELKELSATQFLFQTYEVLQKAGFHDQLVLDLSEIGRLPYYSGLVFKIYVPGYHEALVSGGRYDGLLKKFGIDSPSVGFSLQQGLIEVLESHSVHNGGTKRAVGNTWLERLANAQARRRQGEDVVL